jgi:hypothetical protein
MKWSVMAYCIEEVRRQGHDTDALDGLWRAVWMLDAWRTAQVAESGDGFFLQTVEELGKIVEPIKNESGLRKCQVYVGRHVPPPPKDIRDRLARWWEQLQKMTPIEAYKEFETIHPFVDGNGRVGKIILNWRNGSLDDPIFPPRNLWGRNIQNP